MAAYPWYTRVGDVLHRMTVLTLVGGSLYMLGGSFYTIIIRSRQNQEKLDQFIQQKKIEEQQQGPQIPENPK